MRFDIITIFPNIFDSYLSESILGRAQKNGLIEIKAHDLREYTNDKHRSVDDSPYGGGVGMVMMVEPIYQALLSLRAERSEAKQSDNCLKQDSSNSQINRADKIAAVASTLPRNDRIILLTPRGKRFTQKDANRLAQYDQIILIAGRYEGVDERVTEFVDEQISIGDFVLSGGEVPAMIIVEAISRLIPGVLGKDESSKEESFSDDDSIEYPHYTRPEVFATDDGSASSAGKKELKVPEVLLSGHHAEIAKWRKQQRKYRVHKKEIDDAIAEGLKDFEAGRFSGPFETADELIEYLHRQRKKRGAKS